MLMQRACMEKVFNFLCLIFFFFFFSWIFREVGLHSKGLLLVTAEL